jgi:hypothetical protein
VGPWTPIQLTLDIPGRAVPGAQRRARQHHDQLSEELLRPPPIQTMPPHPPD